MITVAIRNRIEVFQRDSDVNGPSMLRVLRTALAGWKRYKNHPEPRIRRRLQQEVHGMLPALAAVAGAAKLYYRGNLPLFATMTQILDEVCAEFGLKSSLFATFGGLYLLAKLRAEERRLANGWTYEPPLFYEVNDAVAPEDSAGIPRCSYVVSR